MSFASDLKEIMSPYRHNEGANVAVKEVLNLVDLHFAKTISEVQNKGLKSGAAAVKGEALNPIDAIADIFAAYPELLRTSLKDTAVLVSANILDNLFDTLHTTEEARKNGLSNEEHVIALVAHYFPDLIEKHPDADANQLRKDLTTITCITHQLLTANLRGTVDRLIEKHKGEVAQHA